MRKLVEAFAANDSLTSCHGHLRHRSIRDDLDAQNIRASLCQVQQGLAAWASCKECAYNSEEPRNMMSVGRYSQGGSIGSDLTIVDPATKLPVGLLPDFFPVIRSSELSVERSYILYDGLVKSSESGGAKFFYAPLDKIPSGLMP